ncbi:hypothetical protein ACLS0R_08140 [Comamonas jiangduensis]|uniref:hypothetical protein n=1 Tax=Comamonas jiangduensis TaxID=1194168 RepID=UPI003BF8CD8C
MNKFNLIQPIISSVISIPFFVCDKYFGEENLDNFLNSNLITILITLLAINSATIGLIISRIISIAEKTKNKDIFKNTISQINISIKEQFLLIFASIAVISMTGIDFLGQLTNYLKIFFLVYSIMILKDIAEGYLAIMNVVIHEERED